MSQPHSVTAFRVQYDEVGTVLFEQYAFRDFSVTCCWPRQTTALEHREPSRECGWTNPTWDEQKMLDHSDVHAVEVGE